MFCWAHKRWLYAACLHWHMWHSSAGLSSQCDTVMTEKTPECQCVCLKFSSLRGTSDRRLKSMQHRQTGSTFSICSLFFTTHVYAVGLWRIQNSGCIQNRLLHTTDEHSMQYTACGFMWFLFSFFYKYEPDRWINIYLMIGKSQIHRQSDIQWVIPVALEA